MPVDASLQLREIALRLRDAGLAVLFNDVRAELRAGAEPLVPAVQEAAQRMLPKAGGLNEWVASQHVSISVRTGPYTAGVRLAGPRGIRSGGQTNRGYVRHPTWGRREAGDWQTEQIPQAAGWWSDTLRTDSLLITPALVATINRVSAWIQEGGI